MQKIFFFQLFFVCALVFPQNRQQEITITPSKIYVGDRATLTLPLPGFIIDSNAAISPGRLPSTGDIDIHRAVLERRPGGSRLIVEFTAFAPGSIEMPPLEIAGEIFSGLNIEVSSVLEHGTLSRVLSAPALPLAIPGTSLLIYGTLGAAMVSLFAAIWILFWGQKRIKAWLTVWKKKRMLFSIRGIEKNLRRALAKGDSQRNILDTLSKEFRSFLAGFTGEHCRAMAAAEFAGIETVDGIFLQDFFSRCDGIRFSCGEIDDNDIEVMLDDMKYFLAELAPGRAA